MANNLFYFSLILFASYISCSAQNLGPVNSTEFDCSTAQPPAVDCSVDPNCLYPNPRNCSQYYQCNDAYLAYRMECPLYQAPNQLLVFNNISKICDFPYNYNCVATPTPSPPPPENEQPVETTEAPTETPEAGSTQAPTEAPTQAPTATPDETPEPTTEEPSTEGREEEEGVPTAAPTSEVPVEETTTETPTPSTEGAPPASVCDSPQAEPELAADCNTSRKCMFPDPDTCQGFIQCQPSSTTPPYNPITYHLPCALGNDGQPLYWNDNSYTCERKENSTCTQFSGLKSVLFAMK